MKWQYVGSVCWHSYWIQPHVSINSTLVTTGSLVYVVRIVGHFLFYGIKTWLIQRADCAWIIALIMCVVGSRSETPHSFCLTFRRGLNSAGTWSLGLTFPKDRVALFDVEAGVWCAVSAAVLPGMLLVYTVCDKVYGCCNPGLKTIWHKVHSLNVKWEVKT